MKKEELITIIIPVYKVEAYLEECIESVICQTYENIEIILIDDGSPDLCPKICDEYAKRDSRIRVVHKRNEGVSVARNIGIELAKGEYIAFVDSDDYINKNYLQKLYDNLDGCCISECGVAYFDENNIKYSKEGEHVIFTWKEYLTETNLNGFLSYACVWGKLYSRSLFDSIRFPYGRVNGEDEGTVFKIVYSSGKVSRIYDPLYFYRQRKTGASQNEATKKRIDDARYLFDEKKSFFKERCHPDLVAFFAAKKAICFIGLWKKAQTTEDKKLCLSVIYDEIPCFIKEKIVPLKYKMYILFFALVCKIRL